MSQLSLGVILPKFIVLALILVSFCAFGQRGKVAVAPRTGSTIVDDSTKSVYGPGTTKWTTEQNLFQNRPDYRLLDTTINNYHRWTYVQRFNNFYKDLGVMGTALSPIFPLVSTTIGATSGFNAYEPYYGTEAPLYYDTKSPFTRMYVVWGGTGRAMTKVEFARNVNPRWNLGFNYRPILVDKQIQRTGKGDRQTISHYYDFFTTYKSTNERYNLVFTFRRIRHRVNENGGVKLGASDSYNDLFDVNAVPTLVSAQSEEYRRNIHLYHQYRLAKPFQLYHIADFSKQTNSFRDLRSSDPNSLFDHVEINTDSINDQTEFISMTQEVGIKGNAAGLFYSGYYKFRNYSYSNPHLQDSIGLDLAVGSTGIENYLGGTMSLRIDSLSEISGSAEFMLAGFYRIEGKIQTPWIEGSFRNTLSKPGLMQQMYRGSHDFWNTSFEKVSATEAQGFLKFRTRGVQLWAGGTFTLLRNYVYFRESDTTPVANEQRVLPVQSSGTQSTLSPEVKASVKFMRHLYFRPQIVYTSLLYNDDGALKIPEIFINSQLAYENMLFNNHLQVQTGIDFHWKSDYQALGYDPVIQQFYVQNTTIAPAFTLVDVFFTGKMRRARFFFKYHNVVQAVTQSGYLPTPGYPGQRNLIDFGFDFLLFD